MSAETQSSKSLIINGLWCAALTEKTRPTNLDQMSPLKLSLIVLLCSIAALSAAEPSPELVQAREAWKQSQKFEEQARHANATDDIRYVELLRKQDEAAEKAEEFFLAAIKKNDKDPDTLIDFGRFWITRKEYGHARRQLEAALRASKGKIPPLQEATLRRLLGGVVERGGDVAIALAHYRQALQLDPAEVRNTLSLAVALCASGMPHDSATLLKTWGEKPPATDPAIKALGIYTLAYCQEQTSFLEEALNHYRQAHSLAAGLPPADAGLIADRAGLAIARLEDFFDAREERIKRRTAETAQRPRRDNTPLFDEKESLLHASHKCDRGIDLKNDALSDASFRQVLASLRADWGAVDGEALSKHASFSSFSDAMQEFQEAILKHPRLSRAYYELATCNVMLGRYGSARKLLEESVLYDPFNIANLALLGDVLLELGQWQEASSIFTRLIALDPESGRAHLGLARADTALQGDLQQCRAALDALVTAARLGVRDRRMFPSQVLIHKDGRELEGLLKEDGDTLLLYTGEESPLRIPRKEIQEIRTKPGLHEQIIALVDHFERGGKPQQRPIYRGGTGGQQGGEVMPDFWRGTVYER